MSADAIVVGSGPSGAHAAKRLLEFGLHVTMLDYGNDAPALREVIPAGDFEELRRTDPGQRAYFLGPASSRFTPPREFVVADAAQLLPVESQTFAPVQSLALGGLGAGWGAGAPTFEPFELEAAGLPPEEMDRYYDDVVADVGVSASADDDTAPYVARRRGAQPPAQLDENARSLLEAYAGHRDRLRAQGFALGHAPLAMLTQARADRGRDANPYDDMDFYGDARRSIYRPRYTIEELRQHREFTYIGGALVREFEERDGVVVVCAERHGERIVQSARALVLAAGALNTARIVLRSQHRAGASAPLLCNPMSYLICVNRRMLGRPARGPRHSLAQLMGVFTPAHRAGDRVIASLYSYRSLMNFRLVREMPLPLTLGVAAARLLATSLTIVAIHHPERSSPNKTLELDPDGWTLRPRYELSAQERRARDRDCDGIRRALAAIGCVTLRRIDTPPGSSIHYAGTVRTDGSGKVAACDRVFAADASGWKALPAKGLTLTLMANARRVASHAARELLDEVRA